MNSSPYIGRAIKTDQWSTSYEIHDIQRHLGAARPTAPQYVYCPNSNFTDINYAYAMLWSPLIRIGTRIGVRINR
jgi:hypothetical protein